MKKTNKKKTISLMERLKRIGIKALAAIGIGSVLGISGLGVYEAVKNEELDDLSDKDKTRIEREVNLDETINIVKNTSRNELNSSDVINKDTESISIPLEDKTNNNNKNNNKNNNEYKISNDTNNDKTIVEDTQIVVDHICEYGEWYAIDDETEERQCKNCDKSEHRGHSYIQTGSTVVENDNGFGHTIFTTYRCQNCGHTVTNSKNFEHNYNLIACDDDFEFFKCADCGKELKLKHKFDVGTKHEDGSITYVCANNDCNYVKTIDKNGVIIPTPDKYNPFIPTNPDEELKGDKDDTINNGTNNGGHHGNDGNQGGNGDQEPPIDNPDDKEHEHQWQIIDKTTPIANADGTHSITYTYSCVIDGCVIIKTETVNENCQTNENIKHVNIDDDNHMKIIEQICNICGDTKIIDQQQESHNIEVSVDENGITTYKCSSLGCTYIKVVEPGKDHDDVYDQIISINKVDNGDGTHTITTVLGCSHDGCTKTKEVVITGNHTFGPTTEAIPSYNGNGTHNTSSVQEVCNECGNVHIIIPEIIGEQCKTDENEECTICHHKHIFDRLISQSKPVDNGLGEHVITFVYGCSDPKCQLTKSVQIKDVHNFGEENIPVITYNNDGTHSIEAIVKVCKDCGKVEVIQEGIDHQECQLDENNICTICGHQHSFIATEEISYSIDEKEGTHIVLRKFVLQDNQEIFIWIPEGDPIEHTIYGEPTSSKLVSDGSSEFHYEVREGKCICGAEVEELGEKVSHGDGLHDSRPIDYTHDPERECYTLKSWCDHCDFEKTEIINHAFNSMDGADFGDFFLEGCDTCSLERAVHKATGEITYEFNEYGEPIFPSVTLTQIDDIVKDATIGNITNNTVIDDAIQKVEEEPEIKVEEEVPETKVEEVEPETEVEEVETETEVEEVETETEVEEVETETEVEEVETETEVEEVETETQVEEVETETQVEEVNALSDEAIAADIVAQLADSEGGMTLQMKQASSYRRF